MPDPVTDYIQRACLYNILIFKRQNGYEFILRTLMSTDAPVPVSSSAPVSQPSDSALPVGELRGHSIIQFQATESRGNYMGVRPFVVREVCIGLISGLVLIGAAWALIRPTSFARLVPFDVSKVPPWATKCILAASAVLFFRTAIFRPAAAHYLIHTDNFYLASWQLRGNVYVGWPEETQRMQQRQRAWDGHALVVAPDEEIDDKKYISKLEITALDGTVVHGRWMHGRLNRAHSGEVVIFVESGLSLYEEFPVHRNENKPELCHYDWFLDQGYSVIVYHRPGVGETFAANPVAVPPTLANHRLALEGILQFLTQPQGAEGRAQFAEDQISLIAGEESLALEMATHYQVGYVSILDPRELGVKRWYYFGQSLSATYTLVDPPVVERPPLISNPTVAKIFTGTLGLFLAGVESDYLQEEGLSALIEKTRALDVSMMDLMDSDNEGTSSVMALRDAWRASLDYEDAPCSEPLHSNPLLTDSIYRGRRGESYLTLRTGRTFDSWDRLNISEVFRPVYQGRPLPDVPSVNAPAGLASIPEET